MLPCDVLETVPAFDSASYRMSLWSVKALRLPCSVLQKMSPYIRGRGPLQKSKGTINRPEGSKGASTQTGDVWPDADRKLWLQLLEGSFKLIYKDAGSSKIPPPPGDAEYRRAQGMPPNPESQVGYKIDLGEK